MILNMITRLSDLMEVDGEVDGSMTPLEELDDTTKMTRKLARGLLY
jgi:hypothetical protein